MTSTMSVSCAILEFRLPLHNSVSRLQDTTAQIRDIAHYVCNVAMGLARDEASFNALARETLHELGLTLDGDGAWSMPPDHPTDEEAHGSTQICKPIGI